VDVDVNVDVNVDVEVYDLRGGSLFARNVAVL
jgi:hypothetical protein